MAATDGQHISKICERDVIKEINGSTVPQSKENGFYRAAEILLRSYNPKFSEKITKPEACVIELSVTTNHVPRK